MSLKVTLMECDEHLKPKSRLHSYSVCFDKCCFQTPQPIWHTNSPLISGCLEVSVDQLELKIGLLMFCVRVCINALRRDVKALIRADPSPLQ